MGLISVVAVVAASGLGAEYAVPSADDVISLPRQDQKMLDQYLGKGVVGGYVHPRALGRADRSLAREP